MKTLRSELRISYSILVKIKPISIPVSKRLIQSIGFILMMAMLFACKNDLETINSLAVNDSIPDEYAKDIRMVYSDSGKIQATLEGPLMINHAEEETKYIEFPEGFKVVFFDSINQPRSEITANYGISYEEDEKMEAKYNVVVINLSKQEKLETEHLIWDRRKQTISSDVFITITKPDQVLYGDGLLSDQDFEFYEIINPRGEIQFYPDADDDEENNVN